MLNHPIFIFFSLMLSEKLIDIIILWIKDKFVPKEIPKNIELIDELSPLRSEIQVQEKIIDSSREELAKMLKEAEKVNTPNTFALYSKMQRKSNSLRDKIEELENNLEKLKGEHENLKKNKTNNNNDSQIKEKSEGLIDIHQKLKIFAVCFRLVNII